MHWYRQIAAAVMVCLCAHASYGGEFDFSLGAGDEQIYDADGDAGDAAGLDFDLSPDAFAGPRDGTLVQGMPEGDVSGALPDNGAEDRTRVVPVPSAAWLAGVGLAGLAAGRRRR